MRRTATLLIYIGALIAVPVFVFLFSNLMNATHAEAGSGFIGYLASLPLMGKLLFGTFIIAVPGILDLVLRERHAHGGADDDRGHGPDRLQRLFLDPVRAGRFVADAVRRPQHGPERVRPVHHVGSADAELQPDLHRAVRAADEHLVDSLAKRGLEPSIPVKFAIALMGVGAGFLFLVWGSTFAGPATTSRSASGGWRGST